MGAGFFDDKKININNCDISPREITLKLLFDQWKLNAEDEEFTLMKMHVSGSKEGKLKELEYFLYDEYDAVSKTSSMSRTTGYTCSAAVNLIAKKIFDKKGLYPPEIVGADKKCFDFVLNYLEERQVKLKKREL